MILKAISILSGKLFVIFCLVSMMGIGSVMADELSGDTYGWRGGPHVGFSPYTGIIGAELQKGHWGFVIGMPTAIGARYYFDDRGYRWFIGAHGMYYEIDDADETKDSVRYDNQESTYAGVGFGYKWRWRNHWDLTVSLSVAYYKERLENDFMSRTDEYISAIPGITFGYTF